MIKYQDMTEHERRVVREVFQQLRPALVELTRVYRSLPQPIRDELEARAQESRNRQGE